MIRGCWKACRSPIITRQRSMVSRKPNFKRMKKIKMKWAWRNSAKRRCSILMGSHCTSSCQWAFLVDRSPNTASRSRITASYFCSRPSTLSRIWLISARSSWAGMTSEKIQHQRESRNTSHTWWGSQISCKCMTPRPPKWLRNLTIQKRWASTPYAGWYRLE